MKTTRLLFLMALIFAGITTLAQVNVTVYVTGHVKDIQTQLPIANHLVAASTGPNQPYADTALTNNAGYFYLSFEVPSVPGTVIAFNVGTTDCNGIWVMQSMTGSPAQTQFSAEFTICNDSVPPPTPCENFIVLNDVQDLTVSLHGEMVSSVPASYFWNLGDGVTATGENITHTYSAQGIYTVSLTTSTPAPNSCTYTSYFSVMLPDSINPPPAQCQNEITLGGIQGLHVTFAGDLLNGQTASYFWELGDGTSATGQNIQHTYAQQGFYNVTLQTITPDSCMSFSSYPLYLGDSINTNCISYIVWNTTSIPGNIEFQAVTPNTLPTQFMWNFGDPASGVNNFSTLQTTSHVYSIPGIYNVVMTSTNSNGCSYTSVASVPVYPDSTGNLVISGQVFAGNNFLSHGNVTLFESNLTTGYYFPIANVFIDSTGHYNFSNMGEGSYIVLAVPAPDSSNMNHYLPTFFGDMVFWEQATPIILGVPANSYNINLVSFDSICCGNGSVIGQIVGGGKSMLTSGQEVLLLDMTGTPVRIAYTDAQGSFSFTNLPYGQYQVSPMVTGTTTVPTPVVLNSTNPSSSVVMSISGHLITGIGKINEVSIIENIYPNPASDKISLTMKSKGNVTLQILDATGKTIINQNISVNADGTTVTLPVSDLTRGLYFLVIRDQNGNIASRQFIKN